MGLHRPALGQGWGLAAGLPSSFPSCLLLILILAIIPSVCGGICAISIETGRVQRRGSVSIDCPAVFPVSMADHNMSHLCLVPLRNRWSFAANTVIYFNHPTPTPTLSLTPISSIPSHTSQTTYPVKINHTHTRQAWISKGTSFGRASTNQAAYLKFIPVSNLQTLPPVKQLHETLVPDLLSSSHVGRPHAPWGTILTIPFGERVQRVSLIDKSYMLLGKIGQRMVGE